MRHPILVFLLLAAGCSTREPVWETPWADQPAGYHPSPAQHRSPVREGRFPVDLPTVLRLAGANNLDIAFVREKVHEAYARSAIAEQLFWPTLFVPGARFLRHEGRTQATDGAFLNVDKQQVFAGGWGSLRWEVGDAIYQTLSASQRYEGTKSMLEATEQSVLLDAASAYYDLVREHLRAKVSDQSAAISEKLAGQLDVAVQAGRGFRGDVLRARVQLAGNRLSALRSREAIKLASIRLGSLLRLAPGIELHPSEEVPALLELIPPTTKESELLTEALESRPEIRQARAEVAASGYDQTGATWAPLIPSVQVDAGIGALGPVPSDLTSTRDYSFTFGWRIGPGGLFDSGRQDLAEARSRQAAINLERVRQKVTDEVLSSLAQLRAKEDQRKLAEQAVKDAEEALRLNQDRQTQNIGIPLEVLQAEEALTRARLDLYGTTTEFNQAQLRALASIGRKHSSSK